MVLRNPVDASSQVSPQRDRSSSPGHIRPESESVSTVAEKKIRRRSGNPEGRRSHSTDENVSSQHPRPAAEDRKTLPIRQPWPLAAGFPVRERTDTAGSAQEAHSRWGGNRNRVSRQYADNRRTVLRRDKRLRLGENIVSWTGPSVGLPWGSHSIADADPERFSISDTVGR
jgi:hypothetical protein